MVGRHAALALAAASVAGCGGLSHGDIEQALEKAWTDDSTAMAHAAGVALPGGDPGALRGLGTTAKTARNLAEAYGGNVAGGIAGSVISGATRLAADFGVEGADQARKSIGIATASDWSVRNLEVLSERSSGDDHVVMIRYDLHAKIDGTDQTLAKDVTQKARLTADDGRWQVEQN
jgi:hypothetical protein